MSNNLLICLAAVLIAGALAYYAYSLAPVGTATHLTQPSSMKLTSTAFEHEGTIPAKYTCDAGTPVSPPLAFSELPPDTASLVLIMDDPDVPTALRPDGVFDHWVLYDIDPTTSHVPEGGSVGTAGANGAGMPQYAGPCPPPEYEPSEHRYFFRLYALDTMLNLPEGATKAQVLAALEPHVIATAELMGRYRRQ